MEFIDLTAVDVVVLNQCRLSQFIELIGDPDLYDGLTILTEDEFTSGRGKLNLIEETEDSDFDIVTQLRSPFDDDDLILDLRRKELTE